MKGNTVSGWLLLLTLFSLSLFIGCDSNTEDDGDTTLDTSTDTSNDSSQDVDNEVSGVCFFTERPDGWSYPAGPYGKTVGEQFASFVLNDCAGNPVNFEEVLRGAELVLINVSAGWCQNCIEESRHMEELANQYCPRGLRTLQILFEDEEGSPANSGFCNSWTSYFGLTFPVLMDPAFTMEYYAAAEQMPLNLLIDKDGVIRYRAIGSNLDALHQEINSLLP